MDLTTIFNYLGAFPLESILLITHYVEDRWPRQGPPQDRWLPIRAGWTSDLFLRL